MLSSGSDPTKIIEIYMYMLNTLTDKFTSIRPLIVENETLNISHMENVQISLCDYILHIVVLIKSASTKSID